MLLYLVRHGKAESGGEDEARRLTDEGRAAVEQVATWLVERDTQVDRIEHSGLVRARETAEILARAVSGEIVERSDLDAAGDVEPVADRIGREGSLMLVGHQPFMGRMASYLLRADPDAELLHFRTGAVACLSDDEGHWLLEWFLAPVRSSRPTGKAAH